eukprot:CAMPEP_0115688542 /NCGR_PEP_ID=MMETSP0272-20121206/61073_1 /TAXON_ID=71861 /ORGANISM="Scrippsiella trochoidea, Strain CCMP3099" /LENGTH=305 /DNA_ID=CAMNT_0003128251 /DNA_START=35 /DNA_END=948 /DNA_ORIENTATION=-
MHPSAFCKEVWVLDVSFAARSWSKSGRVGVEGEDSGNLLSKVPCAVDGSCSTSTDCSPSAGDATLESSCDWSRWTSGSVDLSAATGVVGSSGTLAAGVNGCADGDVGEGGDGAGSPVQSARGESPAASGTSAAIADSAPEVCCISSSALTLALFANPPSSEFQPPVLSTIGSATSVANSHPAPSSKEASVLDTSVAAKSWCKGGRNGAEEEDSGTLLAIVSSAADGWCSTATGCSPLAGGATPTSSDSCFSTAGSVDFSAATGVVGSSGTLAAGVLGCADGDVGEGGVGAGSVTESARVEPPTAA